MLNKSQPNKYVVAKEFKSLKKRIDMYKTCVRSLGFESKVLSLEKKVDFAKSWSFCFLSLPAFCHQITDFAGATAGRGEDKAWPSIPPHVGQIGQYFGITLAFVGLLARKG